MKAGKLLSVLFAVVGIALLPGFVMAEEGGSGHYTPGAMASFIDGVPQKETFLIRADIIHYNGSVGATKSLPVVGKTTLGADASLWGVGLTALWRPPLDLGERWSYAMSASIPYLFMDISVDATTSLGSIGRSSNTNSLGDILLMPLMLNYNVNPDFNVSFRVGTYAPTGSYELGRLANTGKNFWTISPILGLMYFGQKNGIEASVFVGSDFNTENKDTNYRSGTQFHIDGTLAQHFPWLGGLAGGGVSGYYYQQVTGDSGSGATLGDFKGQTVGVGPVISYITKIGTHDVLTELKWLHEIETENRLKGDIVLLKAVYMF
jgi:hypothetical protein